MKGSRRSVNDGGFLTRRRIFGGLPFLIIMVFLLVFVGMWYMNFFVLKNSIGASSSGVGERQKRGGVKQRRSQQKFSPQENERWWAATGGYGYPSRQRKKHDSGRRKEGSQKDDEHQKNLSFQEQMLQAHEDAAIGTIFERQWGKYSKYLNPAQMMQYNALMYGGGGGKKKGGPPAEYLIQRDIAASQILRGRGSKESVNDLTLLWQHNGKNSSTRLMDTSSAKSSFLRVVEQERCGKQDEKNGSKSSNDDKFNHDDGADASIEKKYEKMDFVYTWVNGSEPVQLFKKVKAYLQSFELWKKKKKKAQNTTPSKDGRGQLEEEKVASSSSSSFISAGAWKSIFYSPVQKEDGVSDPSSSTVFNYSKLFDFSKKKANRIRKSRDRESDELRFSIRSYCEYVTWHRGRLIVVTPSSQIPDWVDLRHLFFFGGEGNNPKKGTTTKHPKVMGEKKGYFSLCGEDSPRGSQLVFLHQDAIVPSDERATFNTNTLEQHLFRIPGLSPIFVQFNDDYFISKPVNVSTFVNLKNGGGPILLMEANIVRSTLRQVPSMRRWGWVASVLQTNEAISQLTDCSLNGSSVFDYLWEEKDRKEAMMGGRGGAPQRKYLLPSEPIPCRSTSVMNTDVSGIPLDDRGNGTTMARRRQKENNTPPLRYVPLVQAPFSFSSNISSSQPLQRRRRRRNIPRRLFLKHAPFVYCKNMLQHYLYPMMRDAFHQLAMTHAGRHPEDYIIPLMHHSLLMEVPWRASKKYLKYNPPPRQEGGMKSVKNNEGKGGEKMKRSEDNVPGHDDQIIHLRNDDACAPALAKVGQVADSTLLILSDNLKDNKRGLDNILKNPPTFFALNDGFSSDLHVPKMIRQFLQLRFPKRTVFERKMGKEEDRTSSSSMEGESSAIQHTTATNDDDNDELFTSIFENGQLIMFVDDLGYVCPMLRSLKMAMPLFTGTVHFFCQGKEETRIPTSDPQQRQKVWRDLISNPIISTKKKIINPEGAFIPCDNIKWGKVQLHSTPPVDVDKNGRNSKQQKNGNIDAAVNTVLTSVICHGEAQQQKRKPPENNNNDKHRFAVLIFPEKNRLVGQTLKWSDFTITSKHANQKGGNVEKEEELNHKCHQKGEKKDDLDVTMVLKKLTTKTVFSSPLHYFPSKDNDDDDEENNGPNWIVGIPVDAIAAAMEVFPLPYSTFEETVW